MKAFKDYEKTEAYGNFESLPKGGYVLKIMAATEETASNNNKYLKLSCDIVEGEYANFYTMKYKSDKREDKKWGCNLTVWEPLDDGSEKDSWTKRSFKTAMVAIEESNEGYHWDWNEKALKGKLVGGLFNERQYQKSDGTLAMFTSLARLTSVDNIREGKYKLPDDKYLDGTKVVENIAEGFMDVDEDSDEGLPFA